MMKPPKTPRQQQRRNIRHVPRLREEMPGPCSGRKSTDRQNSRPVDGAVQGHSIRRVNRATVLATGQILKGLVAQGRIRCLHRRSSKAWDLRFPKQGGISPIIGEKPRCCLYFKSGRRGWHIRPFRPRYLTSEGACFRSSISTPENNPWIPAFPSLSPWSIVTVNRYRGRGGPYEDQRHDWRLARMQPER